MRGRVHESDADVADDRAWALAGCEKNPTDTSASRPSPVTAFYEVPPASCSTNRTAIVSQRDPIEVPNQRRVCLRDFFCAR
ncbi:unnamed protein product [Mesocestoides corti]|uniref:Uncharacterized protein n=1 Tax=Mesocestoides corti TaxID=53468 RepID=A0A0R3UP91_MESCO|nr:unnamed protein product [Mesocestoides corti]